MMRRRARVVGGHGNWDGLADGVTVQVSMLRTREIHTDGGIPAGTPDLVSGLFVISKPWRNRSITPATTSLIIVEIDEVVGRLNVAEGITTSGSGSDAVHIRGGPVWTPSPSIPQRGSYKWGQAHPRSHQRTRLRPNAVN
jgi:hypothetical protein